MIDILNKCPSCGRKWDGGDIKEVVSRLDVFSNRSSGYLERAANSGYGYSPENPNRFTKAIIIEKDGVRYIKCHSILCGHIFNIETEEEYCTMADLESGYKLSDKKPIILGTGGEMNVEDNNFFKNLVNNEEDNKERDSDNRRHSTTDRDSRKTGNDFFRNLQSKSKGKRIR